MIIRAPAAHHQQTFVKRPTSRWCNFFRSLLFFLPAAILLLEHIFRPAVFLTEDGYREEIIVSHQNFHDQSQQIIERRNTNQQQSLLNEPIIDLDQLTTAKTTTEATTSTTTASNSNVCPGKQIWISNTIAADFLSKTLPSGDTPPPQRKIPRIVHQTSKSRCVTEHVWNAARQWQFPDYEYYLHDDEAVMRLLTEEFLRPEFPHLSLVARNCLIHGTLKADLWRYVILWVFGGIYADIDSVPAKLNVETTIQNDDDAFFVVEQYHLLSQWFMAVSPKHPIMYYAILHSLSNLLKAPDTGRVPAAFTTGPHALHAAYMQFRLDGGDKIDPAGTGYKPVWAGHFTGTQNRTVTIVGVAANQNEYVNRDVLRNKKAREYEKMGMRHFQQDQKHASGISCFGALFQDFSNQT